MLATCYKEVSDESGVSGMSLVCHEKIGDKLATSYGLLWGSYEETIPMEFSLTKVDLKPSVDL